MTQNKLKKARTQPQEKHVLYGIITLFCLAPLPFGSDRPLPIALITASIGALSIYWGIFARQDLAYVRVSLRHIKWFTISSGIALLWALMQVLPLNIASVSHYYWMVTDQLIPTENIHSYISAAPRESWISIYKILAYLMLFWLTLQLCRSSNNSKKVLLAIAISGAAYSFYGLLIKITGSQNILWFDKKFYVDSLTSTFVNRNNFATYAGVCLVASLAILIKQLLEDIRAKRKRDFYNAIIQKLFSEALPSLLITCVILTALIVTNSRAGVTSSFFGIIAFILMVSCTNYIKKHRWLVLGITIIFVSVMFSIFSTGGDKLEDRFGQIKGDFKFRSYIYNQTLDAIKDAPFAGTGLGSYASVIKAYRDTSTPFWLTTQIDRAHNSYLEMMLELGIPAALMLIIPMVLICIRNFTGIWKKKKYGYLPAASVGASIIVGIHALVDFSAQIPAVTIVFIVLLAMGLAQSWSGDESTSDKDSYSNQSTNYHNISTNLTIIIGAILLLSSFWQGYVYFMDKTPLEHKEIALEKITSAIKTEAALSAKDKELLKEAKQELTASLTLSPVDAYAWAYLAYIDIIIGEDSEQIIKMLSASISSGMYEKPLGLFRTKLIPIIWDDATEEEQEMLKNQLVRAWMMDKRETVLIMKDPYFRNILRESIETMPDAKDNLARFDKMMTKPEN